MNNMGQLKHKIPKYTHNVQGKPNLHLLLLANKDQTWARAVQRAVCELGNVSLQQTGSVDEAIRCLVMGDPHYSHFLVESGCADERIGELAKLTQGESHNATALVMLGAGGRNPPRASVVGLADERAVTRAIVSKGPGRLENLAPLGLDELNAALTGAQLQTRYQPIVRLADGTPIGLEVLARLDHPAHGTLSAEYFIPQMERVGLSQRLTQVVVRRAFDDYQDTIAALGLSVALNFPLDTLMEAPVMRWLEQQRQQSGIAANRIIIELTETQPVAALDAAGVYILRRAIAGLRDLGYGVALDDVGPAMPNHRALFGLNFSSVKLDKDLVFQAADNPEAGAFLAETIALAHAAGCAVVAEGVRDLATWERMRRAGADLAQGFMVARPLPAASVGVWMQGWQTQQGATDLHEHQPA